jgi:hypothetical protein
MRPSASSSSHDCACRGEFGGGRGGLERGNDEFVITGGDLERQHFNNLDMKLPSISQALDIGEDNSGSGHTMLGMMPPDP